jgi:DUF3089 family protein
VGREGEDRCRGGGRVPHDRACDRARNSRFVCFYVYLTVSTEPGLNSDLTVRPAEVNVAMEQTALFSQVCDVWAPMYRQITVANRP